jgi:hypothetical protein
MLLQKLDFSHPTVISVGARLFYQKAFWGLSTKSLYRSCTLHQLVME